jgi:two-component system cell cycle response regulator
LGDTGRVVVAEKNPVLAGALSWLLREHGYDVTTVSDRNELFAAIEHDVPDLILLDSSVSSRVGDGILGELRGDDRWNDVRIVVTTPWQTTNGIEIGLPWGADDCVAKPFRVAELLGRVRTQIRANDQLRSARAALIETTAVMERERYVAANNRRLVEILHEVTGELSANEIYRLLARRMAESLEISNCSIILARPSDTTGTIVATNHDIGPYAAELKLEEMPEIRAALQSDKTFFAANVRENPLFEDGRTIPSRDGRGVELRSVAVVPFGIDRSRSGVLLLRTGRDERALTTEDVAFADVVLRAAVAIIRRAQALESTRADNRRLEALATTDPLTRVLNRRAFLDRLTAEVDRSRRYDSTLALLLFDVDHFKRINDTVGHLAGDSVLRQMGAMLEDAVRKVDIVARYGGEEFVVLLPETGTEGARTFADRVLKRVAAHEFGDANRSVHVTLSIGVACYPLTGITDGEELLRLADQNLYRAKMDGRNRYRD